MLYIDLNAKRRYILPENIRISVVEAPCTTERYVYFAGSRGVLHLQYISQEEGVLE